jgi:hypothetical protein
MNPQPSIVVSWGETVVLASALVLGGAARLLSVEHFVVSDLLCTHLNTQASTHSFHIGESNKF